MKAISCPCWEYKGRDISGMEMTITSLPTGLRSFPSKLIISPYGSLLFHGPKLTALHFTP
jgi:hypothetical protein